MSLNRRDVLKAALLAGVAPTGLTAGASAPRATPDASPVPGAPPDEDGYDLWLRYRPVTDDALLAHYRDATARVVLKTSGPIAPSIASELNRACSGMLGHAPATADAVTADGTILIGTTKSAPDVRKAIPAADFSGIGDEGFILRGARVKGHRSIVIAANHERGLLYGTFSLIRQMQLRRRLDTLAIVDRPKANLRMVNHWDDYNRLVSRGYAGLSIFDFSDLTKPDPRYTDYARILASVGVNATVINSINANPAFLTSEMMPGYASLAAILRQWGIRLFLSANFATPIDLRAEGWPSLTTADPLDKDVQGWWARKVDEIYEAVPDFGGFLVKANSEGQPGPLTYGRTHAEGANMFARALAPHGGIVIWRSFVHRGFQTWSEFEYDTFHPLDGKFDSNAILQTKNGPIDFMVREPVNPLFGAMPKTNQMIELQITQEYTGHATHLCYLPVYWKLVLDFDTHHKGTGPTVAEVIDGEAEGQPLTGFAGVINFGDDRNWTGSFLAAANTHGFARLAWDHTLDVRDIAAEWVDLTFGPDTTVTGTVAPMLLSSWRTYEKYTSPFGVGYLMQPNGNHYSPDPRGTNHLSHFTDSHGSGFDRTLATGSGYTRLYSDYWFERYERLESCPEDLMMFMHIVPWSHRLANGKTTIQQIYDDHFAGVDEVIAMAQTWASLRGRVDALRFNAISDQFERQLLQSLIWRNVLVSYYFDNARTTGTEQSWIQLEKGLGPNLVIGGHENEIAFDLTNATDRPQSLVISTGQSPVGWTATPITQDLGSGKSRRAMLVARPPVEPFLGPVAFSCSPEELTTLGFDTQMMIVTPAADQCTYALDVGSSPDDVVVGYTALTHRHRWDGVVNVGWVGMAPADVVLARAWGPLQNTCASDSSPGTLRLVIPAGTQRGWALVGGRGVGTPPVRISSGKQLLAETGYLDDEVYHWLGFTLDGGRKGETIDLTFSCGDGQFWRLAALVLLKPGV